MVVTRREGVWDREQIFFFFTSSVSVLCANVPNSVREKVTMEEREKRIAGELFMSWQEGWDLVHKEGLA